MLPRRPYAIENDFVAHVQKVCRAERIKVELRPVKRMRPGYTVGYFDWEERRLTVAARAPKWFESLIHEFCHLEQSLEGLWVSQREQRMWDTLDAWVAGDNDARRDRIEECVRVIQACELDCEKRAARYIRRFGFPSVDLDRYIRSANLYVLSYEAARRTRRWHQRPLSKVKTLISMVPSTFVPRLDRLPPGYLDRYLARC